MTKHVIIGLLLLMAVPVSAQVIQPGIIPGIMGCDYYAAPSDAGGSALNDGKFPSRPFRIADFWAVDAPGTTLCLLNGTYAGTNDRIVAAGSGSDGSPIVIRALHEGGVVIKGDYARSVASFTSVSWIDVEGINFCCTPGPVISVTGGSQDVNFRRVIAWDANGTTNVSVVHATGSGTARIEFADSAFFGVGRKTFTASQDSVSDVTCRRCWLRYEGHQLDGGTVTMSYNSVGTKFIDSFITYDKIQMAGGGSLGLNVFNDDSVQCNPARLQGTLIYIRADQTVLTGTSHPLVRLGHASAATNDMDCMHIDHVAAIIEPGHPTFSRRALILSHIVALNDAKVSNFLSVAGLSPSISSEWDQTNVVHSTTIPSLGASAHPWTGTTGANLCYLYGTTTPRWPWIMNDRLKAATAASGAYAGPCTSGCTRTTRTAYDVMAEIEDLLGTIPSACKN